MLHGPPPCALTYSTTLLPFVWKYMYSPDGPESDGKNVWQAMDAPGMAWALSTLNEAPHPKFWDPSTVAMPSTWLSSSWK